jgi:hypothetical protein
MAFDKLYVVNRMMICIGETTLASLGTDSKSQRLANDIFDGIVAEVFALPIEWHFATAHAELAKVATDPALGYDHQYKLPDGCVRVISTIDENYRDIHYEYEIGVYCHTENGKVVQDDVLLCDQDEVFVKYIVLRTNPGSWRAWFTKLVILTGAIEMCAPIAENDYRKMSLQRDLDTAMDTARYANGLEGMDVDIEGRDLLDGQKDIRDGFMRPNNLEFDI